MSGYIWYELLNLLIQLHIHHLCHLHIATPIQQLSWAQSKDIIWFVTGANWCPVARRVFDVGRVLPSGPGFQLDPILIISSSSSRSCKSNNLRFAFRKNASCIADERLDASFSWFWCKAEGWHVCTDNWSTDCQWWNLSVHLDKLNLQGSFFSSWFFHLEAVIILRAFQSLLYSLKGLCLGRDHNRSGPHAGQVPRTQFRWRAGLGVSCRRGGLGGALFGSLGNRLNVALAVVFKSGHSWNADGLTPGPHVVHHGLCGGGSWAWAARPRWGKGIGLHQFGFGGLCILSEMSTISCIYVWDQPVRL